MRASALLLLSGAVCWSADPVQVTAPVEISFEKQSTGYKAGFVHSMQLKENEVYFVPVLVATAETNDFLRSLEVRKSDGEPFTSLSFYLEEEEWKPLINEQLPNVINGDDFDIAAFRRLLLGKRVTIVAEREGITADLAEQLDQSDAQRTGLSGSLIAPKRTTVTVEGELLGIAAHPGTLKLMVTAGADRKIMEINQDSIISFQFSGDAVGGLSQALQLKQNPRDKRLILQLTPGTGDIDLTISYQYDLQRVYEIELTGELSEGRDTMTLRGWIKLRNATPWDWVDTQVTLVTQETDDKDYVLEDVSLEQGKVIRYPVPRPADLPWALQTKLRLLVGQTSDGVDQELPVQLQLELNNAEKLGAMSVMADRLLVREGENLLGTIEDFGELEIEPKSPHISLLGTSDAIKVSADQMSDVPLTATAVSPSGRAEIVFESGRFIEYRIESNDSMPHSVLPILLTRSDTQSYKPVDNSCGYTATNGGYLLEGKKDSLKIIEPRQQPTDVLLSLKEARIDDAVGGLKWIIERTEAGVLRQVLEDTLNIRSALDEARRELALLESQLVVLKDRQAEYFDQPQSEIHGVIIRELDDLIYNKGMQVYSKRAEVAKHGYRLDRLVQSSLRIGSSTVGE